MSGLEFGLELGVGELGLGLGVRTMVRIQKQCNFFCD